jgi:hypothetical protein
MKTTIKLIAAFSIMLLFAADVLAQTNTANAPITASANVAAAVTVAKDVDLYFGNVVPGLTKTVGNDGGLLAGTAGGTIASEGRFIVTKGINTQVTLGFGTLPTNLTITGGGSETLPINFTDFGGTTPLAKVSDGTNNAPFTPASGIVLANTGATAFAYAASTFKVHIGGTVVPSTSQLTGTYQGTITLTATYN